MRSESGTVLATAESQRLTKTEATEATDELEEIESHDEVVRLLLGLAPKQRAAVLLTAILEYSADEAGQMLGLRASSVRALTTRARAQMKNEVVNPA